MPTIEQICDSILSGETISSIDIEGHEKAAHQDGEEAEEVPEYEKIARILEEICEGEDSGEKETEGNEKETVNVTTPSSDRMEKMAVAATVLDTLNDVSMDGSAEKCFKEYFQERV